jgi:DNA modification methylase
MIDLRLGDCLAGMATLEDKSVGVTLCDPPYAKVVVTSSKRAVRRSMAARKPAGFAPSPRRATSGTRAFPTATAHRWRARSRG